jgi:serine/threonine protein kinase
MMERAYSFKGSRWERLADAFEAAASLPAGERRALLDQMLGSTGRTRHEVASMLDASESGRTSPIERKLLGAAVAAADAIGMASLTSGVRIGSWSIEALEGAGGMGEVYRAARIDGAFEQRVAIKVMRRATADVTDERTRRFEAERRILARLEHPDIVGIIDGGWLADGRPYFVMPLIEGKSLLTYCDSLSLSIHDRISLLARIARAVGYAHARGVVHRDLKPSNILVGGDGRPHLLDFGIAKLDDDGSAVETRTGAMLLTPAYAAPEQLRGASVTPATDVYALGMLLRELMARCDAVPRAVLAEIGGMTRRALEEDPVRRYSDANAMATELERILRRHFAGIDGSEDEHASTRRRRTRRLATFGAAAAVSLGVATMSASRFATGDSDEVSHDAGEPTSARRPAPRPSAAPALSPTPVPGVPSESTSQTPAATTPASATTGGVAGVTTPPPRVAVSLGETASRVEPADSATPSSSNVEELRRQAAGYNARRLTVPALTLMDSVVDRVAAREGPTSVGAAHSRAQRAILHLQLGAFDDAERDLTFADSVLRHTKPRSDTLLTDVELFRGMLDLWRDRPDSALAHFQASYAGHARARKAHPKRAAAACGIGLSLAALGRVDDANQWVRPFCSMQQRFQRGLYRQMVELMQEGVRRARSAREE